MAVLRPRPAPYQAGNMWRDWVQANTQGTERSASKPSLPGRTAGREPICMRVIDVDGRDCLEPGVEIRAVMMKRR